MEADGYGGVDEDDYLCIGDHICLYIEQASGYLFSEQSNSEENGLYMFHQQSMDHPNAITNPHALSFRILVQNRYKLHKRYRQLLQRSSQSSNEAIVHQTVLEQAKAAADGEVMDNNGEQKRLHGKPVKYGDIIQLLHLFSDKCIHVNQKKTSAKDHGQFTAHHLSYDSKDAQFTILPKYKINAEGETVRAGDQVVFESVQCPGRFFHASPPFTHYNKQTRHELNLGRLASEFTIIKRFQLRNYGGITHNLWGGAVVYMHHKDIEAYLACDGVFGEDPFEDVSSAQPSLDPDSNQGEPNHDMDMLSVPVMTPHTPTSDHELAFEALEITVGLAPTYESDMDESPAQPSSDQHHDA